MLTEPEIATARAIVKDKPAGRYMLKELYGEVWQGIRRPRHHGRWFKFAVLGGALPRVRLVGRKSNNCLLYEVLPGPAPPAMTQAG